MAKENKLTENYQDLYSKIEEILFRHDPIGINLVENADEYDPEVSTILPRLKEAKSENDVLNIVCEEFGRWFGADLINKDSKLYKEAAKEIWIARNEFKTKTTEHANQPDAE